MRLSLIVSYILLSQILLSQAPALIPYQAVARQSNGQPLDNTTLSARFTIHDESVSGPEIWQESQLISTSALGLFTAQLGIVQPLLNIDWSNGNKFLEVEIELESGFINLGTQQLLSVPYAMHANSVRLNVSQTGDTLFIGNNEFVVIPGISEANQISGETTTGTTLHSCGANNIHNPDLTYGSLHDQEGNIYKTIIIGEQEWMAENLNTSIYQNGDSIATNLTDSAWINTPQIELGAWAYFNNDASFACPFGKLYNWYACADLRQLCPTGWHIPTNNDWNELINFLQENPSEYAGVAMKTTSLWQFDPFVPLSTNSSGFSALPSGYKWVSDFHQTVNYGGLYLDGFCWSASELGDDVAWELFIVHEDPFSYLTAAYGDKRKGVSVRCIKD
jgi:uncharacterized protein (TIGR02145 family)